MIGNDINIDKNMMQISCNPKNIKLLSVKSMDPLCDSKNIEQKFMSLCDGKSSCAINDSDIGCSLDIDLTYACVNDVNKDLLGKKTVKSNGNKNIKSLLRKNIKSKKQNIVLEQQSKVTFSNSIGNNIKQRLIRLTRNNFDNLDNKDEDVNIIMEQRDIVNSDTSNSSSKDLIENLSNNTSSAPKFRIFEEESLVTEEEEVNVVNKVENYWNENKKWN